MRNLRNHYHELELVTRKHAKQGENRKNLITLSVEMVNRFLKGIIGVTKSTHSYDADSAD